MGEKHFGRGSVVCYVRIYEHEVGKTKKPALRSRTMTVHNHSLDDVVAVVEKAFSEAFGS